ncbi:MAG TPA: hypothetical protein DGG94_20820 [Micromonosporaceae bacterium]|nr:hypothetical protein [Micromonosporaceae bacterium]
MAPPAFKTLRVPDTFWSREQVHVALREREIGSLFGLLQRYLGASQTQIGSAVEMEQGNVSRIMKGRRVVAIDVLDRIAIRLEMPDSCRMLLGLAPRSAVWRRYIGKALSISENGAAEADEPTAERVDTVYRRDFITLAGAAAMPFADLSGIHDMSLPDTALSQSVTHIGASDVESLVAARARYEYMYRIVGGGPVRTRIAEVLTSRAIPALNSDYSEAVGRELFRAAGSLQALSGVCSYDLGRQRQAQQSYFDALRLARASSDRTFEGHDISLLATQALRTSQFKRAIEYTDTALNLGHGQTTPALDADLYCIAAEAYANLGDLRMSLLNIGRAEREISRIRFEEEPPETRHLTPDVVTGRSAMVHRRLGRIGQARRIFEQIETAYASHPRATANRLAARADFLVETREYEEAAIVGMKLLSATAGMESWLLNSRIKAVRDALENRCKGRIRESKGSSSCRRIP